MNVLEQVTEFLGWTLIFNTLFLIFATFALAVGRSFIVPLHTRLLGLEEAQLQQLYASYLSNFKLAVLVLNFSPYIALKAMGY